MQGTVVVINSSKGSVVASSAKLATTYGERRRVCLGALLWKKVKASSFVRVKAFIASE